MGLLDLFQRKLASDQNLVLLSREELARAFAHAGTTAEEIAKRASEEAANRSAMSKTARQGADIEQNAALSEYQKAKHEAEKRRDLRLVTAETLRETSTVHALEGAVHSSLAAKLGGKS